jgi:hypothetical protein
MKKNQLHYTIHMLHKNAKHECKPSATHVLDSWVYSVTKPSPPSRGITTFAKAFSRSRADRRKRSRLRDATISAVVMHVPMSNPLAASLHYSALLALLVGLLHTLKTNQTSGYLVRSSAHFCHYSHLDVWTAARQCSVLLAVGSCSVSRRGSCSISRRDSCSVSRRHCPPIHMCQAASVGRVDGRRGTRVVRS